MHALVMVLGATCCASSAFVGGAWWASAFRDGGLREMDASWIEPRPRSRRLTAGRDRMSVKRLRAGA